LSPQPAAPVELFYSYAHEDGKLRDELDTHLATLKREGVIRGWHDRAIVAGREWGGEIDEQLKSADILLLLVSPDFLASDYCHEVEVKQAMRRHEAFEARVIPIILRPSDWTHTPFSKLQALPKNAKPITLWGNSDEAFLNVARGIRKAAEELLSTRSPRAETEGKTADSTPHVSLANIPRPPLVGFVARRDEQGRDIVGRLREDLAPRSNKLVTLSGPGGVGKTTLAAEAARALADDFAGRLVWSSADGRASYSLSTLLDDIATQLGRPDLRPLAPDAKKEQVHALVADPPVLVVLDNYETVAPDERGGIEEWFTQSRCSSLITSRQRVAPTLNINIAAMSREEAEELLERLIAQTQDPEMFSASVRQRVYETAEANPFLIEWVVAQIDQAQEPDTVFAELAQGEGDAAERVFDRSFNLPQVGDDGRAALLALSLFSPSASREALAAVSGFGDDPKRFNEAVKNLRALWLIKGLDENRRFTIEGLTRTLAAAHLSKDARANEFGQRFVAYFLDYVGAHTQPTPEDYNLLEEEKDNLSSATDAAFFHEAWESVVPMAFALARPTSGMFDVRGYWDEALRINELALQAARLSSNKGDVASLAHNVAIMHQQRGEREEARRLYDESLEINKKLGDQSGIAITLHELGRLAQAQGDLVAAQRLYDESLELKKNLGDQSGIASSLHQLGMLAQDQGDKDEARRLYDESLEINKKLGNQSSIASTLHNLAVIAQAQGDLVEARRLYDGSLEIKRKLGDQSGIASSLHQLGMLAEEEGDKSEAVRLFRDSLNIFERLGSPYAEVSRRCLKRVVSESS
jgi:tetratricopeptide (TPR) repeat protein